MSRLTTEKWEESVLCCLWGSPLDWITVAGEQAPQLPCPGWFWVSAGLILAQMQWFMNSAALFHSPEEMVSWCYPALGFLPHRIRALIWVFQCPLPTITPHNEELAVET